MIERVLAAWAVVVLAGLVCPLRAAVAPPQNVILIGWDGAQREHVEQCLVRKELPSLQRLLRAGKYVRIDVEGTTDTKAGASAQPGAGRKLQGTIVEENGVKYRVIPGSPYYGMHTALEVWEFGLMEDRKVGSRAIELLDKYRDKPFFFFVHFAEVDHAAEETAAGRVIERIPIGIVALEDRNSFQKGRRRL